uniref:Riboflavin transporter MCH5 n=1 Tax=Talaromyces marneffei PM1 TaxID=1077442 RepID=A0A093W1T9_TALMA
MALESSSTKIHHTTDNGKLYYAPGSDGYNTPSVELTDFAPFGNILNPSDGSIKHLAPPRVDNHDGAAFSSDHPPVSSETTVVDSFPDGGTRSWLVVLGSFLLLMASYGMMNSVGVFQSYLETNQLSSYSSADVGWIPSSFVFVALLLGVYVGPLFDSHGPKLLVYGGSVIFMVSLLLFAECRHYWQFLLSFGVIGGIGAALVSTVAMACVPHWFEIRAGMAIGTALAGSGLGGIVFPFVMRAGFSNIGFKWTMRVLAFVVGFLCLLGSFMVRARLPKKKSSKAVIDLRCFKDLKFTWMTLSTFCLELQYFSLLGMYPIYIIAQGFSTDLSVILLVILNVFGTIGRLIAGRIADRYGRLNTLTVAVFLTTLWLFVLLYPFQKSVPVLYVFSCLYGLTASAFISVSPVCIRQISDAKEIGLRFGTCYSVVSFAGVDQKQ